MSKRTYAGTLLIAACSVGVGYILARNPLLTTPTPQPIFDGPASAPQTVSVAPVTLNTTSPSLAPSTTPSSAVTATPTPLPSQTPAFTPPPLPQLVGTMAGSGHNLAVLQKEEETRVCHVGETFAGYKIVEITPYRVRVTPGHDQIVVLELGASASPGPVSANPQPAATAMSAPAVEPAHSPRARLHHRN